MNKFIYLLAQLATVDVGNIDNNSNICCLNMCLIFLIFFIFILLYDNNFKFIFIHKVNKYGLGGDNDRYMSFICNSDANNECVSSKNNITFYFILFNFLFSFHFCSVEFNKIMMLYIV